MEHDRLFKELLATFFFEFLDLFFPEVAAGVERTAVQFLDKEIFTDVGAGDRHEVDLLAKVRLRGREAFILIHVENQSTHQSDFPERMFHYCARIHEKHRLPIFPIALLSYDRPLAPAADTFVIDAFGLDVLRFRFRPVQLNRLSWRDFLSNPNPVAGALMSKMDIAPEDRPRVKVQCLRMLVTLRLDPAKSELIGVFMNSYLKLSAAELIVYNREVESVSPAERDVMRIISNEWTEIGEERGLAKGLLQGRLDTLNRQLRRRFGDLPAETQVRLGRLGIDEADELADALFDFRTAADLQEWLDLHA